MTNDKSNTADILLIILIHFVYKTLFCGKYLHIFIEIKSDIKINTLHSHFNIMHTCKYVFAQTHYNIFMHAHRSVNYTHI